MERKPDPPPKPYSAGTDAVIFFGFLGGLVGRLIGELVEVSLTHEYFSSSDLFFLFHLGLVGVIGGIVGAIPGWISGFFTGLVTGDPGLRKTPPRVVSWVAGLVSGLCYGLPSIVGL
jgi:hypothetical protein